MENILIFYMLGCLMVFLAVVMDAKKYEDELLTHLAPIPHALDSFWTIFLVGIFLYCLTSWYGFYKAIRFYLKNGETK
jgi:hypothetical protein